MHPPNKPSWSQRAMRDHCDQPYQSPEENPPGGTRTRFGGSALSGCEAGAAGSGLAGLAASLIGLATWNGKYKSSVSKVISMSL